MDPSIAGGGAGGGSTGSWGDTGGYIYAGGQATYVPNKLSFYNTIANNRTLGVDQFTNNPFGVSSQEIQGLIDQGQSSPLLNTTGYNQGANANFNPQINSALYDAQKGNLNTTLSGLDPQSQAAQASVLNQYQTNLNSLDTSRNQSLRNLDQSQQQVDQSKATSLQQIKDQVGSMYNSYLRQPGVSDSSAGGMIANALGASASKNRFSVLQNAGTQQQQIGNQTADLENQYQTSHASLDAWKQNTLNTIGQDFAANRAKIQRDMASADSTQAQALAQQNASYTQQAIDALRQLQAVYSQTQDQINSSYTQNAPTAPSLGALGQYQVQAINPGQLAGIRQGSMPNQTNTPDLAAPLFKRAQDQYGV